MESLQKQRIESPLITCVTRKVDSLSFDGGMISKEGVNKSDVDATSEMLLPVHFRTKTEPGFVSSIWL